MLYFMPCMLLAMISFKKPLTAVTATIIIIIITAIMLLMFFEQEIQLFIRKKLEICVSASASEKKLLMNFAAHPSSLGYLCFYFISENMFFFLSRKLCLFASSFSFIVCFVDSLFYSDDILSFTTNPSCCQSPVSV